MRDYRNMYPKNYDWDTIESEQIRNRFDRGSKDTKTVLLHNMVNAKYGYRPYMLGYITIDEPYQLQIVNGNYIDQSDNEALDINKSVTDAAYIQNLTNNTLCRMIDKNTLVLVMMDELPYDVFLYGLEKYLKDGYKIVSNGGVNRKFLRKYQPFCTEAQKIIFKQHPRAINYIDHIDEQALEVLYDDFLSHDIDLRNINNYTENELCALVYAHAEVFRLIDNPTEKIKRTLLNVHSHFIEILDNPSLELQLQSIRNSFNLRDNSIKYIDNPHEYAIWDAITLDPANIQYIENPSYELQKYAVENNSSVIQFICDPYEDLQILAIDNDWCESVYHHCVYILAPHSKWFNHELNKLKLKHGGGF